jgi:hypothetical protein
MAQSVYLREQTERCRRLELANEYVASAARRGNQFETPARTITAPI